VLSILRFTDSDYSFGMFNSYFILFCLINIFEENNLKMSNNCLQRIQISVMFKLHELMFLFVTIDCMLSSSMFSTSRTLWKDDGSQSRNINIPSQTTTF
jgi:hypothetical protein